MRFATDPVLDIAFVTHAADRTGAPRVLLEVAREAVGRGYACRILALQPGPMVEEFAAVAPTQVVDPRAMTNDPWWVHGARHAGVARAARRLHLWRQRRSTAWARRARVVLLNSVASAQSLSYLAGSRGVVVTAVHELRHGIDLAVGDAWSALAERTHRFVAASSAVSEELQRREIPRDSIDICRDFVSLSRPQSLSREANAVPLVVAMGSINHRKGCDLFVQVAIALCEGRGGNRVRFRWIGSDADADAARWMRHDLESAGLTEAVELTGEVDDPSQLLADGDVFVLTSREDPFPLACLEAAMAGTPIVAFDCGGLRELLQDAAVFVPVPRVDLMAVEVDRLLDQPDLRSKLSKAAQERVSTEAGLGAGRVVDVLARHL